jgi:hypothetical protein
MNEEWRQIKEFEFYEVSNLGNVRSKGGVLSNERLPSVR